MQAPLPAREPGTELLLGEEFLLSARENTLYGFDWVGPDSYVGVETIDDVPCYVFEQGDVKAWIDQKKREPVLWKSGTEVRYFKHNGNPSTTDIPQAVMARIDGVRRDIERLRKSPKGG